MNIHSPALLKLLLPCLLFINPLNPVYACSPVVGEEPASITEKAQDSTYVFEGVVTEIAESYVVIKVEQYFKGKGESELKIIHPKAEENSCTDSFVLNQRALFFTQASQEEGFLELVYDASFGSVREMNPENFSEISTITKCMGTYRNAKLNVPCILHQESQQFYQAELKASNVAGEMLLIPTDVQDMNAEQLDQQLDSTECIATYTDKKFIIPCIAVPAGEKIYQSTLRPTSSTDVLQFSILSTQPIFCPK